MASPTKQLLGTETVRAMRARGVKSLICGLSANDMQSAFLEAGADTFLMKPLPCKQDALLEALQHIWAHRRDSGSQKSFHSNTASTETTLNDSYQSGSRVSPGDHSVVSSSQLPSEGSPAQENSIRSEQSLDHRRRFGDGADEGTT